MGGNRKALSGRVAEGGLYKEFLLLFLTHSNSSFVPFVWLVVKPLLLFFFVLLFTH